MNKFVNREKELKSLKSLYDSEGANLVVIYGRRRLGKTALIKKFATHLPHCYFLADRADEISQMNSFANSLSEKLNAPLLSKGNYHSWYDLFQGFDHFRPNDKKFVLIIDEFQYLCQTQRAFSSFIQKWWDEHWCSQNIMLILCGSVTSMMYKETLAYSAPLYGRSDLHILMRPLPAKFIKDFFCGTHDQIELVKLYSLTGGVPKYLLAAQNYKLFDSAFSELILDTKSPMFSEAKILLQDEVTSPNICWSLLQYIGEGATRISELAAKLRLPANQLTRYIDLLKDLQLVKRDIPVLETAPHKSKKGVYKVTDPYFKLWFSIVYPYESFIEFDEDLKSSVRSKLMILLEKHFADSFEDLSRQYVQMQMSLYDCLKVGRQWGKNYEIDIAGVNDKNQLTVIGECKWSSSKLEVSVFNELISKVETQNLPLTRDCKKIFFSKSGFTEKLIKLAEIDKTIILIEDVFA